MTTQGKTSQNGSLVAEVFEAAVEICDFNPKYKLAIFFPVVPPLPIEIKPYMKTTAPAPAPTSRNNHAALSLTNKPFTEMMLNPEKLEEALKQVSMKAEAPVTRKKKSAPKVAKSSEVAVAKSPQPADAVKKTSFNFVAGNAGSVKLVGDFTNWEKASISMSASRNGTWSTEVPLKPGQYAYRFIVDGKWQDDPNCHRKVSNPFGTQNSVVVVI